MPLEALSSHSLRIICGKLLELILKFLSLTYHIHDVCFFHKALIHTLRVADKHLSNALRVIFINASPDFDFGSMTTRLSKGNHYFSCAKSVPFVRGSSILFRAIIMHSIRHHCSLSLKRSTSCRLQKILSEPVYLTSLLNSDDSGIHDIFYLSTPASTLSAYAEKIPPFPAGHYVFSA